MTVDGQPLPEYTHEKQLSRDGFEWSYEGAAPAQLAFALLADCCGVETASRLYKPFMKQVVANFNNEWEVTTADVRAAAAALEM